MIVDLINAIRERWERHSQLPFSRLVRLFLNRIFYGGGEASADGLELSMGLLLSLLALPGGFYSLILFDKYGSLMHWMCGQRGFDALTAAAPDEYFLIVLSMTVTAAAAVWRWDSIFPDRRDYANLAHLPISTRSILLANLTAVVFLAGLLSLDVNAASAVLFPVVVSSSQETLRYLLDFAVSHVLVVVLASVFSFFAVFAMVGVLMFALPHHVFRRLSLYLGGLIIACLVAMLSTSFAVPSLITKLPNSLIRFLPPVWFLGLCQVMRGKAAPPLAALGWRALTASAGIILVAVGAYALSYRRYFVRIPEATEATSAGSRGWTSLIFDWLDRTALRTPLQRAGYRFVMKTLWRSERHGLVLAGFVGFGIVLASQAMFAAFNSSGASPGPIPSAELLSIPLILSYCIIVGLRVVFETPTELPANWVFKLLLEGGTDECVPMARKAMLTFVVPWVWVIVLPMCSYFWSWMHGLLHTAVVTVWSFLLASILLMRFRKLPFTCSYPPFKDSAVVVVLAYILGFFVYVVFTSQLERWAFLNPTVYLLFILITGVIWYILSRFRQDTIDIDKQIIFEQSSSVSFELLDLNRGA